MNKILYIFLILFISCSYDNKQKELELKEKQLLIKERQLYFDSLRNARLEQHKIQKNIYGLLPRKMTNCTGKRNFQMVMMIFHF